MAELSTQEQILIELKRQNALLEEQLRPQREADARKKNTSLIEEEKKKVNSATRNLWSLYNKKAELDNIAWLARNRICKGPRFANGMTPYIAEEIRKTKEESDKATQVAQEMHNKIDELLCIVRRDFPKFEDSIKAGKFYGSGAIDDVAFRKIYNQ